MPKKTKITVNNPDVREGRLPQRYKLPPGLDGLYKDSLEDPELLSLRSAVALVETRIAELVSQLKSDQTPELWQELKGQVDALNVARNTRDQRLLVESIARINEIVKEGASAQQVWDNLFEAISRKKEIGTAEWRRLADMRCMMTAERAFGMVNAITEAVLRNVPDEVTRRNICRDIMGIVQTYSGQGATGVVKAMRGAEQASESKVGLIELPLPK